jgi:hypothetical protein
VNYGAQWTNMGLLHERDFVVLEIGSYNVKAGKADPNQLPSVVRATTSETNGITF